MSQPKKHHYVPAFYLKAFADAQSDRLFVFDRAQGTQRSSNPRNEGHQRNLNRTELVTGDPNALEHALARLESRASPVITRMLADRRVPEGADRDVLLEYLAVQTVRTPSYRESITDFEYEGMAGGGPNAVDPERFRHRVIAKSLMTAPFVRGGLEPRNWFLWIAGEHEPDFITCDNPVAAVFRTGTGGIPTGPGALLLTGSDVFFPLGPRAVLVGTHDAVEHDFRIVTRDFIAMANTIVGRSSSRFIWSRRPRFVFTYSDRITDDKRLFAHAR